MEYVSDIFLFYGFIESVWDFVYNGIFILVVEGVIGGGLGYFLV